MVFRSSNSWVECDIDNDERERERERAFAFDYMPAITEAIVVRVLIHCQKPLNDDASDVSYPFNPPTKQNPINKRP